MERREIGRSALGILVALASISQPLLVQADTTPTLELSELMYDLPGSDSDREWVELTNTDTSPVTMVTGSGAGSWRFFDTSNHTLTLVRGNTTVSPEERLILAQNPDRFLSDYPSYAGTLFKTAMSLPNTQATLKLSADKGQTWFHERSYQASAGANGTGESLEWLGDRWQPSSATGGTPGYGPTPPSPSLSPVPAPSSDPSALPIPTPLPPPLPAQPILLVSEIHYNPPGSDRGHEWLEFENVGLGSITVVPGRTASAWRLVTDGERHTLLLRQGDPTIRSGGRFIIVRDFTQFLTDYPLTQGTILEASFTLANSGGTLSLASDGANNLLTEFLYQSTAGGDSDGRTLERDPAGVWRASPTLGGTPNQAPAAAVNNLVLPIAISEFLPWPKGESTDEWIELTNRGPETIALDGWYLDDSAGGSAPYPLPSDLTLRPGAWLTFARHETNLILGDDHDEVRLLNNNKVAALTIPYSQPVEGESWVTLPQGGGGWTAQPSPGQANMQTSIQAPLTVEQTGTNWPTPVILATDPPVLADQRQPKKAELGNLPHESGWHLTVHGKVTESRARSAVIEEASGPSLQVRFAASDRPKPTIHSRDQLTVTGILHQTVSGPELRVTNPETITVISAQPAKMHHPPAAKSSETPELIYFPKDQLPSQPRATVVPVSDAVREFSAPAHRPVVIPWTTLGLLILLFGWSHRRRVVFSEVSR